MGSLTDLDTQIYPVGTQLYLSGTTAGAWTSTKPYAPIHLVYVGIVVRSHPTQGVVEIRIQNGYELDELHDVSAQNPTNGDILQYVSATDLWTKVAGTTTNIAEGTNLYFTDTRARAAITLTTTGTSGAATYSGGTLNIPQYQGVLTNPVTGTGTSGQVAFWNGTNTQTGNNNLFWDATNDRLGIGINSPLYTFHIRTATGGTNPWFTPMAVMQGSGATFYLQNTAAGGGFGSFGVGATSGNFILSHDATKNFVIQSTDGVTFNNRFNIVGSSGNVGINQATDAGFRLDVNGTARVQSTLSVPVTSSASITNASIATLAAGYSGSARTDAFIATNSAAGTGTNLGIPALNSGGSFAAIATTTGYNTGLRGIAFGSSSINMGFYGDATTGTSGNNIGAFGRANNSGAGMYVGGYFSNSITTTFPTISANAALIADNGTTSSDIFIAQVNGSAVLNIKSTGQLNTTGSITAASAIARGVFFNNTLVAAANNDVLVGLDINPTFTNGAFTGVTNYALRSQGRVFINPTIATTNSLLRITDNTNGTAWMGFSTTATTGFFIGANGALTLGRVAADNTAPSTTNATINLNNASENITLNTGVANKGIVYTDNNNATIRMNFPSANEAAITTVTTHNLSIGTAASTTAAVTNTIKFFGSSNNVGINQTTDAGFRLDVNGTARVQSSTVIGNNTTNSYIQLYNTASDTQSDGLLFASTGGLSGAANIQLGAKYGASNRADLVFKIFNGNYFEAIRLTASTNNVIIGGTAFTSDIASAKLQIISTTQGFLPPRMTTTQKNAISSPATGLVVYDTTLNKLSVYTGSAWETVTSL
jgi:hypothetical protein